MLYNQAVFKTLPYVLLKNINQVKSKSTMDKSCCIDMM